MNRYWLLWLFLLIPLASAIDGNFIITGGSQNGTNGSISAGFYAVYGINAGLDLSYSTTIINDTPVITIIFPTDGSTITKTTPIELELVYTTPLGSTGTVIFYNYANSSIICTNTSIASGSTVKCPVSLNYGDTFSWYVEATDSYATTTSSILTFIVKALGDTAYFAMLILLPVIFGLIVLIGTISMSGEHDVLKFVALPLSLFSVIASMHFASLVVNDINPSMSELQTQLGRTTYWMGWMIAVLFFYILLYVLYKLSERMAKQKEEKLKY